MMYPCSLEREEAPVEADIESYGITMAVTRLVRVTGSTSTSKTDAFALYPASSSVPIGNPPFKYKLITYTAGSATAT